jgi:hypothetical protein
VTRFYYSNIKSVEVKERAAEKQFEYTSMESFIMCTGKQNAPKACYVPEQI